MFKILFNTFRPIPNYFWSDLTALVNISLKYTSCVGSQTKRIRKKKNLTILEAIQCRPFCFSLQHLYHLTFPNILTVNLKFC